VVFSEITSFGRLPRTCAPTLVWLPSVRKFPWATPRDRTRAASGRQHQTSAEAPVARVLEGGPSASAARDGLPAGFGNDFAGVVDEAGDGVTGFAAGARVYGGARGRAVADYAVVWPGADPPLHTPDGVDDITASTLVIAGRTADAVINAIGVHAGDTVLIGGAAGGVGVFTVQLARRGRPGHRDGIRGDLRLPARTRRRAVAYGDGLAGRVRRWHRRA
jgi:hypothetical protein